ncbi:hypothetical protein CRYUN_Cryun37aG0067400 [Craigia yunnanensis]
MKTEKGVLGLPDLMKAAAEVLGNVALGSSYKALIANGVAVVVKKMREMNVLGKDAFDAKVKKLGKLRQPNILTPFAYHYRKEEKLFVYEYLPKGSLLYNVPFTMEESLCSFLRFQTDDRRYDLYLEKDHKTVEICFNT